METKFEIIPATAQYLEAAAALAVAAWTPIREEFRQELGDELYQAFFDKWQERKRRDVIRGLCSGHGFVTIMDGRLVGFICYSVDAERKIGTIENNAVSSEYQGHGIGSAQYLYVKEDMKRYGLEYVDVDTGLGDIMISARRAYEKAGFKRCLKNVHYYQKL